MYISFINIKNIESFIHKYNNNITIKFEVNKELDYKVIKEYEIIDKTIIFYTYNIKYKYLLEVFKFIANNDMIIIQEILNHLVKIYPNVYTDFFSL